MAVKLPVVAYWRCDEGARAEVTQTRRAGGHLNTRCDCCGYSQATGAKRQQKIWDEMELVPGAQVTRPTNVVDKPNSTVEAAPEVVSATEPTTEVITKDQTESTYFDPRADDKSTEQQTEDKAEEQPTKSGRAGKIVGGLAFVAGVAGAFLWNL